MLEFKIWVYSILISLVRSVVGTRGLTLDPLQSWGEMDCRVLSHDSFDVNPLGITYAPITITTAADTSRRSERRSTRILTRSYSAISAEVLSVGMSPAAVAPLEQLSTVRCNAWLSKRELFSHNIAKQSNSLNWVKLA